MSLTTLWVLPFIMKETPGYGFPIIQNGDGCSDIPHQLPPLLETVNDSEGQENLGQDKPPSPSLNILSTL